MNPKKKKITGDVSDEVEELLRAAEDAALLKLTLNSHTVHASPSDLHPDLEQRFRDLRAGPKPKAKKEAVAKTEQPSKSSKVKDEVEDDDLFARFSALKASLPKPPPSASSSLLGLNATDAPVENAAGGSLVGTESVEDDEEDEVEKVIRWAMDAARLDPSLPSDEETKDDGSDDSEESDEDDYSSQGKKKKQQK